MNETRERKEGKKMLQFEVTGQGQEKRSLLLATLNIHFFLFFAQKSLEFTQNIRGAALLRAGNSHS